MFISTLDNPEERLLFSETIEVTSFQAEPAWQPIIVDLSDFAGQEINLALVTSGEAGIGAGWADPVLSDNRKVELLYYGPNSIYLNKNHLPRAWIIHQVTEVPEEDIETVKAILAECLLYEIEDALFNTSICCQYCSFLSNTHTNSLSVLKYLY